MVENASGTVEAASGGYVDVQGNISGGQALIVDGTLEYDGHSDVATAFTDGVQGALVLGAGSSFTGRVSGFAAGDAIDFKGVNFGNGTHLTYSAEDNTLTVIDGQDDQQAIKLSGDGYGQSSFALFDDGTGHAAITVLQSDPGADNWSRDAASTRDLFQYVSDPTATWLIAQAGAVSTGGYLAAITGPEENSFILSLSSGQAAWLGGSDNEFRNLAMGRRALGRTGFQLRELESAHPRAERYRSFAVQYRRAFPSVPRQFTGRAAGHME